MAGRPAKHSFLNVLMSVVGCQLFTICNVPSLLFSFSVRIHFGSWSNQTKREDKMGGKSSGCLGPLGSLCPLSVQPRGLQSLHTELSPVASWMGTHPVPGFLPWCPCDSWETCHMESWECRLPLRCPCTADAPFPLSVSPLPPSHWATPTCNQVTKVRPERRVQASPGRALSAERQDWNVNTGILIKKLRQDVRSLSLELPVPGTVPGIQKVLSMYLMTESGHTELSSESRSPASALPRLLGSQAAS